jgi:Domain of unknown function (DUF4129)
MVTPGPPLRPSGAEGRHLLREELIHGEYHRRDLVQRVLGWLLRRLQSGVDAASGASALTTLVTMLVAAALAVGLALLLSRLRRDRRRRARSAEVLTGERVSAADLRRRAEAALAQGQYADAVTEAFRALAARQVERGRLEDQPGSTAHEVAVSLAASYPAQRERVGRSADLFDATFYGDRPAGAHDASGVLELDDELAGPR